MACRILLLGLIATMPVGCGPDSNPASVPPRPLVAAVDPMPVRIPEGFEAFGSLEPVEKVAVAPTVSGRITAIGTDSSGKTIHIGSHVDKAAVLARIDPGVYEVELKQAEAGLRRARAALAVQGIRVRQAEHELMVLNQHPDSGKTPPSDIEGARLHLELQKAKLILYRTEVDQAEAAVEIARTRLDRTVIRSPITGVVLDKRVEEGMTVTASMEATTAFTLVRDLKQLQLWVRLSPADVGKVHPGQTVTFTVDVLPSKVFKGKVRPGSPQLASSPDDKPIYIAVAEIDNKEGRLQPYMSARVRFPAK